MKSSNKKILLVNKDETQLKLFHRIFYKAGYIVSDFTDFRTAYEKIISNYFDAIIVDVNFNLMEGLDLISKVRKINKNIIIFATVGIADPKVREKVLQYGVDRYFAPPFYREVLVNSIEFAFRQEKITEMKSYGKTDFVAVGIAASTGGPLTLKKIISEMEYTNQASFFIVLHAPAWMLESYTQNLNKETDFDVLLAEDGMKIETGKIYFAPGNFHMVLNRFKTNIRLNQDKPVNFVRPSADPLFKSLATAFGTKSIAVILTGMGYDGTAGAMHIANAGGLVIAQDPDSAVIHSMPLSVINSGLADKIAPVQEIPAVMSESISSLVGKDVKLVGK